MKKGWLLCVGLFHCLAVLAQTNKIVFVCEHGSAKSVIAATYFNKLARERNIPWQAVSRGTNPDAEISPKTKKLLASENLLDNTFTPRKISQTDVDVAQQVVLFFSLPETIQGKNKTRNWLEIQSVNDDYQKLRNDILSKVTPLIDSLAKR